MSLKAMTLVFEQSAEALSGANRMVLLVLAEHTNGETGVAFPSVARIARRAGLKREETAREALRWLEAGGWIERRVEAFHGIEGEIPAGRRPNVYRLTLSEAGPTGAKIRRQAKPPVPRESGSPENGERDSPENGPAGSPESGEQNRGPNRNGTGYPPVVPPAGGQEQDQPDLFTDPATRGATARTEQTGGQKFLELQFEEWWAGYPSIPGRPRGVKSKALTAYLKTIGQGVTTSELLERRDTYLAARALAETHWGGVAPLLHGSTFLSHRSRRHTDWIEPVGSIDDERLAQWQGPMQAEAEDQGRAAARDFIAESRARREAGAR